jgi:hypothetical protein
MPPKEAFEVVCPYPPTSAQPGAKTFSSISPETRGQALSNGEKFLYFSDNLAEKAFDWKGGVVGLWAWI